MKFTLPASHPSADSWPLTAIAGAVLITGLLSVAGVLFAQLHLKETKIVNADADVTLLVGLTFIYLASLLRRGKRTAWMVALPLYIYIVIRNIRHFGFDAPDGTLNILLFTLNVVIPAAALGGLVSARQLFTVRSELRSAAAALRRAALVLLIAFLYGLLGFQLLDVRDFHQEISLLAGAHYTVDQFGLTTNRQLEPHTKRSVYFLDSLVLISAGSLFYVVISLFAPIRFRLSHQQHEYEAMRNLLQEYPAASEDFFKLWPHDKAYFFNAERTAGLAYRAGHGAALVVSDPAGSPKQFKSLLEQFSEYCRVNDWEPALIHIEHRHSALYKQLGFDIQKIGEEAVVDISHFVSEVATNKYFRNIARKFTNQQFSCRLLTPPHAQAVIRRLQTISNAWLELPGRSERGFMMGYFSTDYMQQCVIMAVYDAAGELQAFVNQIPSFNPKEANFDLLRHLPGSAGNINDFLMLNFIAHLREQGFTHINMGLCPLAGLDVANDGGHTALDSALRFVYANGDRFYSFSGLKRFKTKYEPEWRSRFIAYRGGLRGFTKLLNALVRAMRVHQK